MDTLPVVQPVESVPRDQARSGTFADNVKLPVHRWFRYPAGFSAEWVESVIRAYRAEHPEVQPVVLDPFAGSGTTVLAAMAVGVPAFGFESHPFVTRIAKTKLLWREVDVENLRIVAAQIADMSRKSARPLPTDTPLLLHKCYTGSSLRTLFAMRDALLENKPANQATRELLWLAITAILRPCSHAGTAQWQYVLPGKTKFRVQEPYQALESKVAEIIADIKFMRQTVLTRAPIRIMAHDARRPVAELQNVVDLVITSPPYPNNYDYADATRLEMMFWGEISSWGDLQNAVRRHIIRSCSQHSAAERLQLDELLSLPALSPLLDELAPVCRELETTRLTRGGKKTYHTMVAAYFADLANVFNVLRLCCKGGARLCFVIGDSAPYGVHVPAEKWLARLAMNAGFRGYSFEKLRDRNIKWKNRKHRVPLHEGRLWIEG